MKEIIYFKEKDIVKVVFDGLIEVDGILLLINDIGNEEKQSEELKILIDSRKAKYGSKPSDLQKVLLKIKEYTEKFKTIRLSIIQVSPYETAISMIMQDLLKGESNFSCRVCSTEQTALAWLQ
jgi:hypothetical protein